MSEEIGVSFEIGGEIPAKRLERLMDIIDDEIYEVYDGPTSVEGLKAKAKGEDTIRWGGTANYGCCDELEAFCQKNNLSYHFHCDAKYEYNSMMKFWVPGMGETGYIPSDQDQRTLAFVDDVRPVADLLVALAKDGKKALPLFINDEQMKKFVERGLKDYKKMFPMLKKKINECLPILPELPPFVIKEEK